MDLLDKKFKEILEFIMEPHSGSLKGDKTICYLTFPPDKMIEVKLKISSWISMAKHNDFDITRLSMAEVLGDFFKTNENRENWLQFENIEDKREIEELYQDLAEIVINNQVIEKAILEQQQRIKDKPKQILLVTDLEVLHPFTRFGPIEQKIYNKVDVPIVVLYPGNIAGSALEFLGIYPPDGNYRSKHF